MLKCHKLVDIILASESYHYKVVITHSNYHSRMLYLSSLNVGEGFTIQEKNTFFETKIHYFSEFRRVVYSVRAEETSHEIFGVVRHSFFNGSSFPACSSELTEKKVLKCIKNLYMSSRFCLQFS